MFIRHLPGEMFVSPKTLTLYPAVPSFLLLLLLLIREYRI